MLARVSVTTASLFSRLASAGHVIAFEPTQTIEKLKTNLARHRISNVEVEPIAIGNQTGRREDAIFRVWGQDAERAFYDFETIDHYRERRQLSRVDCIKIDTDSFEFEALMGAEQTLLDCNPWVVVKLNHALSKRNQSATQALEWLSARGYFEALVLDYDNYLVKRRSLEAKGCETGFRLFFDQHRIESEHDLALGDPVHDAIDLSPIFHNDARLEDLPAGLGLFSVVAPGPRWTYAVSLRIRELVGGTGPGAVRARLIVTRGTIGVGCLAPDGGSYVGSEVCLAAATDVQEALVVLRNVDEAQSVIFRNAAAGDAEGRFVLVSLELLQMQVAAPLDKPSYMLRGATRIDLRELRSQLDATGISR